MTALVTFFWLRQNQSLTHKRVFFCVFFFTFQEKRTLAHFDDSLSHKRKGLPVVYISNFKCVDRIFKRRLTRYLFVSRFILFFPETRAIKNRQSCKKKQCDSKFGFYFRQKAPVKSRFSKALPFLSVTSCDVKTLGLYLSFISFYLLRGRPEDPVDIRNNKPLMEMENCHQ